MTHSEDSRSAHGKEQDERWGRYVSELALGGAPPFDEQLQRFNEIYRDRRAADGPPLVWQPTELTRERSNLGRLMRDLGVESTAQLHAWSTQDRSRFWKTAIERLGIVFEKAPDTILDLSRGLDSRLMSNPETALDRYQCRYRPLRHLACLGQRRRQQ